MPIFSNAQQEIADRMSVGKVALSKWTDWKWQMRNCIKSVDQFETLLGIELEEKQRKKIELTIKKFPLSITPYYLSLIDPDNFRNDPVFRQSFGGVEELITISSELKDPLSEEHDSPVEGITHRYPDRVLFHVSNVCAMYCRHCTRKRKVGDVDFVPSKEQLQKGIDYIKETPAVRDVLLSGGDPFLLPDSHIDWLLSEISAIPHVQIIRVGTRTPVVLPYRITDNLIKILKKYHPLWINTHFNHPREITESSKRALSMLADNGFPLGNQSVLLADVNDCPRIMKQLVQNRVRPYYLYQCDLSEGLSHFRTPVAKGIEILESLIGHTTGFAVPRYVIDAPGGGGKIPVSPNYLISWSTNKVILRNYEGVITAYKEPENYTARLCDRNCKDCDLDLNLEEGQEIDALGIEKILSDEDETISLIPRDNERFQRRDDDEE